MRRLNYEVDANKRAPAEVVREWLKPRVAIEAERKSYEETTSRHFHSLFGLVATASAQNGGRMTLIRRVA